MNKSLIQNRFKKNLENYNSNAKIQLQMADRLLEYLPQNNYNNVLEIGCGTGLLTQKIIDKISYKQYVTNDIVCECEPFIKKINNNINFVGGDIEVLINNSEQKYDLIISNAALQWIENINDFVQKLYERLNPNGILLFSTFGRENYREIYHTIGNTLEYFSVKELNDIFEQYSPHIEEEIRIMAFKTPLEMLKHIKKTGVNGISNKTWTKNDLKNFEDNYLNFCGTPTLTYNPIYVKILKII